MFQGLGSLTDVSLNNNAITSIEAGTFEGLGSLTELYLSSNAITSIEAGTFEGLGSLMLISVGGINPITCDDVQAELPMDCVCDDCADTNSGASDVGGADCAIWFGYSAYCSPDYDDGDFTLQDMCCACGGGSHV